MAIERFADAGFAQYEISNFARPGEECRHNLRYWRREQYLGFGIGAHSFIGDRRFANTRDIHRYIAGQREPEFAEVLGEGEVRRETIFLRLRQAEGIDYDGRRTTLRRGGNRMDGTRLERRVAAAGGKSRGLHHFRFPFEQRVHVAAFLIAFAALPLCAQDIKFDPTLVNAGELQRVLARGRPGDFRDARAARARQRTSRIRRRRRRDSREDRRRRRVLARRRPAEQHVHFARLHRRAAARGSKGFGFGTISGTYAKISNSGIKTWGGALDTPLLRGGSLKPELALRLLVFDADRHRCLSRRRLTARRSSSAKASARSRRTPRSAGCKSTRAATFPPHAPTAFTLTDKSSLNRYTVGVRLSLLVPKLVVEATQAEQEATRRRSAMGF